MGLEEGGEEGGHAGIDAADPVSQGSKQGFLELGEKRGCGHAVSEALDGASKLNYFIVKGEIGLRDFIEIKLFQKFSFVVPTTLQYAHLMYGYLIEFHKSFALWHPLFYKHGIEIFHIRQADKFID